MDHDLLGQILATVVTAAVDADVIVRSGSGDIKDPLEIGNIISGFMSIWLKHPASGADVKTTA